MPPLLRFGPAWLVLLLCLGLAPTPGRAAPIALYEGRVVVADQSEAARRNALGGALAQVLIKASGDRQAPAAASASGLLAQPESLLRDFEYQTRVISDPVSGLPVREFVLVARFDPTRVNALMREAGLPFWGAERPQPLVFLGVDEGGERQLLGEAGRERLRPFLDRLEARGVPILLPLLDLEELSQIDSQDFWAGFGESVRRAGQRYLTPLTLSGRLYAAGSGYQGRFALYEGSREEAFEVAGENLASTLEQAADVLADRLGARFAVLPVEQRTVQARIEVEGVRSSADYVRVMGYLTGLSVVRSVQPEWARGERIRLRLDLSAGSDRLLQAISLGLVLVAADARGGDPVFLLMP